MTLHLTQYEFVILMWVYNWSPEVDWIIRSLMAVVGGALGLMGKARESTR